MKLTHYGIDPNATRIDARGCTGLTELQAPNATRIYASGCTGLTELQAPNATVRTEIEELKGMPMEQSVALGGPMHALLTAGGASMAEVIPAWNCHSWENCPLHVAFGVTSTEQLPIALRDEGNRFLALFDANLIDAPTHLIGAGKP
jgi:hypothetical protein